MIITFIVLLALAIGFVSGALMMAGSKPLAVSQPTPTITSIPMVPTVVRRGRRDVWN